MEGEFKYWAFISYSHRDKAWGDWLHKTLETFRTPKRLAGRASRDGTVPRRLYPVFRDRDELPSSASLGENIDQALKSSRYLIVICSPRAAVSRWVDGEIRQFKKLGRGDRVLALVVDGEPNATDRPESGELECFPPALRFDVDRQGNLTPLRAEPIAADARPEGDGRANARLKILAGLLGVGYDELKQREKQRRFWRRVQAAAAGVLLAAVLAGGWTYVVQQKNREALAAEYTEQGRQLFTAGKPLQAAVYLSEAYRLGGRSPPLRFLLARSMRYVDALKVTVPVPGLFVFGSQSRDGTRVATASFSDKATVWDSRDGHRLLTLQGTGEMLLSAQFSPDDRYIVGSCKPNTMSDNVDVDVWDAKSGKPLYHLPFPDGFMVRAAFDGAGGRMLTRDERHNLVQIWDMATGKELFRLPATMPTYRRAGFSADGRYLITAQADNSVHIWSGADGRPQHVLRGHTAEVTDFTTSNDGKLLATVSKDKSVQIWNLATGQRTAKLARKNEADYEGGHSEAVNDAEFTPDGKRLITASDDKTARVWDVASGKSLTVLARMDEEVQGSSVSPDGHWVAVMGKDSIWLYDLDDYSLRAALKGSSAGFQPDGKTLVTFDSPGAVAQVWDLKALVANRSVAGEHAAFSPDESRLATINYDVVSLWDADGKLLKTLQMPPDPQHPENKTYADQVQWNPDGTRLLVEHAEHDYVPGLWDASGRQLAVLRHGLRDASTAVFTPDGRRVFACGTAPDWKPPKGADADRRRQDGRVGELWDAGNGTLLKSFPMVGGCPDYPHFDAGGTRMVGTVRFDPNDREVDYRAELWDLAAARRIAELPGLLDGYYDGVAFTPDSRAVLSATSDGQMHEWDPATGKELRHWDSQGSAVESLLYSPDGRSWVAAHRDGTLQVLDTASNTPRWQMKGEEFGASAVNYSPDGAFLLMQGSSKPPRILDAANGALLMELPGDATLTENTGFSPRGSYAITGAYYAQGMRLWDMHLEGREAAVIAAEVRCKVRWKLQAGQLVPAVPSASCTGNGR